MLDINVECYYVYDKGIHKGVVVGKGLNGCRVRNNQTGEIHRVYTVDTTVDRLVKRLSTNHKFHLERMSSPADLIIKCGEYA